MRRPISGATLSGVRRAKRAPQNLNFRSGCSLDLRRRDWLGAKRTRA